MAKADFDKYSDEELIKLLRGGDQRVMEYLLEKYKKLVKIKVGDMFIPGGDKEDLIQEGMMGLFLAISRYRPDEGASFQTFANLCIHGKICNAIEAGNRNKNIPLNTYISIYGPNSSGEYGDNAEGKSPMDMILELSDRSPEEVIIDNESAANLERMIFESLSKLERQVFELHLVGMGYVEIAGILGKEEKSIDNTLSRIKKKVKKILSEGWE